jgi:hypothetical protein
LRSGQRERLARRVDDDEVVAEALHLRERERLHRHGRRAFPGRGLRPLRGQRAKGARGPLIG